MGQPQHLRGDQEDRQRQILRGLRRDFERDRQSGGDKNIEASQTIEDKPRDQDPPDSSGRAQRSEVAGCSARRSQWYTCSHIRAYQLSGLQTTLSYLQRLRYSLLSLRNSQSFRFLPLPGNYAQRCQASQYHNWPWEPPAQTYRLGSCLILHPVKAVQCESGVSLLQRARTVGWWHALWVLFGYLEHRVHDGGDDLQKGAIFPRTRQQWPTRENSEGAGNRWAAILPCSVQSEAAFSVPLNPAWLS